MEEIKNSDSHHEKEKKELFNGQQYLFKEIYKNGFSNYVQNLKNFKEAFVSSKCICCMDEGTPHGLHSAGSGILRDKGEVLEAFKAAGVNEITSHDGCGAAGLFAKAHNLNPLEADEYGKKWAQEIAAELGVSYRHISSSEMSRPKEFHIARVAYYDATGKFDYSKVKDLPSGFIISRGIQTSGTSVSEANVAFNIATGDHGFGTLVNKNDPFIVVAIAKDEEELALLMNELEEIKRATNDQIKIDGFIAPKIEDQ